MATSAPRTLADQLRGWSDEQLTALLLARPDVATPAPHDSAQLASRLVVRASVLRALDQLDALQLGVLHRVVAGAPLDRTPAVRAALDRLAALALVWGTPARPVVVLGEILRGTPHDDLAEESPALATDPRDQAVVDRAGAGAAFEMVRRTELLLDRWGTHPPPALRGGGLGVRELKAAATFLHVEPALAALVIETAASAGLLAQGMTEELDSAWLPTDDFDAWLRRSVAERWELLTNAWLTSPRLVSLVGSTATGLRAGKAVNALTPDLDRFWASGLRRDVLHAVAALPAGEVLAPTTGVPSLLDLLRWRRPRQPESRLEVVEPTLVEAAAFGVTALDGLSGFGRALLADGDVVGALAPLLPSPVEHLLVQADLTAVAPGPLVPELAHKVALLAEVESRGGATVYRFDAGSVRRAFDAGWSAAEVHEFLAESSRTAVPQALTYLVDDVARRFGTLRAGHAESFLRSDDEAALAELVHSSGARSLGLRRIAPTVVVSDVPLATLLPRLRELGFAPVVEAPDGSVRVARPDIFRARSPRSRRRAPEPVRLHAHVARVIGSLRAGDRATLNRPRPASVSTPADVVAMLRQAAEAGTPLVIGYVGNDGTVTERPVTPERVEGGQLTAYDERSDAPRTFAVHRITAVSQTR